MKKLALLLALLFSISIWFSSASLLREFPEEDIGFAFVLPASLVMIEDEAFEATAAQAVLLTDSLSEIGERAFADSPNLKSVIIPESVVFIGEHAFDGVSDLVLHGEKNSYAARWAEEHNVTFVPAETAAHWIKMLVKLIGGNLFAVLLFCCVDPRVMLRLRRKAASAWRSMRPQDRPELYPIDYRFP